MPYRDLSPVRRDMQKLAKYHKYNADRWAADGWAAAVDRVYGWEAVWGAEEFRHEHVYEMGYEHCVECMPRPKPRDFYAEALEELSVWDLPDWLTVVPSSGSIQPRRSSPWARHVATLVQMVGGAGGAVFVDRFIWNLWP